ncbi:MAG: hypothetical protein AB1631_26685 [Acidobacteriota bacterium]
MLFRRRWVQAVLDDLAENLTEPQLRSLTKRLNSPKEDSLHAQWEVAVVWAASRVANIEYEPDTGGERRADLVIRRPIRLPIEVMAEITSVSSKGFDDLNPTERFHDQLFAELRELWSEGYGYKLNIGTYHTGRGSKMKFFAAVPHPKDYERFFGPEFDAFVRKVKRREACSYEVSEERVQVALSYDPNFRLGSMSGGWNQMESFNSLTKNPIYSALKEKKRQIKETGYTGLKGIVVCDSGTATFQQGRMMGRSDHLSLDWIVDRFLSDSPNIDFVVAVTSYLERAKTLHSIVGSLGYPPPGPDVMLYTQRSLDKAVRSALGKLFTDIGRIIPKPLADGRNVLRWQRRLKGAAGYCHGDGDGSHSLLKKSWTVARIPARLLVDYLLDDVTKEQFQANAGIGLHCLREAKKLRETMRRAQVIRRDEDDDWFEIQFEGPDPAEGQFKVPTSSKP